MQEERKPSEPFFTVDGRTISNVNDFLGVLGSMDDNSFYHHVNEHKNDFSSWLYHSFNKKVLAEKLGPIKSREETIKIIKNYLNKNKLKKKQKNLKNKQSKNPLISGNIKEKIKWYIKAHGHSSIGGLNLIWTYFSFNEKKETADIVDKAIKLFENFANSNNLKKQLSNLKYAIVDVEKVIKEEQIEEEKREEMLEILRGVRKNVTRISKILKNPGYEEKFKLSKILFSAAVQLLKQYPDILYGDLVGNNGKDIGDRIKLTVKESAEEKSILCCGYEMQLLLFNLLSNAVESIKDKGNIYIEVAYGKGMVRVDVADDGNLISEKDIQKIITHKEFSTKGKEHGHGLKIVGDILEKYGGALDVASDQSKHLVTFSVAIPLKT